MKQTNPAQKPNRGLKRAIIIALLAVIILVLAFHILLPLLGMAFVLTAGLVAGAWGIGILSIVILCMAILLFFILPGILIIVFSSLAFLWVLLAIVFFPILFPLLIPLLIVLLFIGYVRRKAQ